jgi:hypothetical protein
MAAWTVCLLSKRFASSWAFFRYIRRKRALQIIGEVKARTWTVDLKESRFSSVATSSIAGFLRLFFDAQGSVAAEGRLCAERLPTIIPSIQLHRQTRCRVG